MTETFILQNQQKLFWGKSKEWVDGYDSNAVFKAAYKDEAINQMVEISAKDFLQRIKIVACTLDEKGSPIIDPDIKPEPLPKQPKPAKSGEDLFGLQETIVEQTIDESSMDESKETDDSKRMDDVDEMNKSAAEFS